MVVVDIDKINSKITNFIPVFNGGDNVAKFVQCSEWLRNQLDDDEKKVFDELIVFRLSGDAFHIAQRKGAKDFENLKATLNSMYTPRTTLNTLHKNCFSCTQKYGETTKQFGYRISLLLEQYLNGYQVKYRQAPDNNHIILLNEDTVQTFKNGLNNTVLREKIITIKAKDIDEIVDETEAIECMLNASVQEPNRYVTNPNEKPNQPFQAPTQPPSNTFQPDQYRSKHHQSKQQIPPPSLCEFCNKLGHSWKECWSRSRQMMNNENSRTQYQRPLIFCAYCLNPGHDITQCRNKVKDENRPNNQTGTQQYRQNFATPQYEQRNAPYQYTPRNFTQQYTSRQAEVQYQRPQNTPAYSPPTQNPWTQQKQMPTSYQPNTWEHRETQNRTQQQHNHTQQTEKCYIPQSNHNSNQINLQKNHSTTQMNNNSARMYNISIVDDKKIPFNPTAQPSKVQFPSNITKPEQQEQENDDYVTLGKIPDVYLPLNNKVSFPDDPEAQILSINVQTTTPNKEQYIEPPATHPENTSQILSIQKSTIPQDYLQTQIEHMENEEPNLTHEEAHTNTCQIPLICVKSDPKESQHNTSRNNLFFLNELPQLINEQVDTENSANSLNKLSISPDNTKSETTSTKKVLKHDYSKIFIFQELPQIINDTEVIPNLQTMSDELPSENIQYASEPDEKKDTERPIKTKQKIEPEFPISDPINNNNNIVANPKRILIPKIIIATTPQISELIQLPQILIPINKQTIVRLHTLKDSNNLENKATEYPRNTVTIRKFANCNRDYTTKPLIKIQYNYITNLLYLLIIFMTKQLLIAIIRITNPHLPLKPYENNFNTINRVQRKLSYPNVIAIQNPRIPMHLIPMSKKAKYKAQTIECNPNIKFNHTGSSKISYTVLIARKRIGNVLPYLQYAILTN